MELTARVARQVGLLAMLLVIVPMIFFPEQFGTSLARASLIVIMYEVVYYGFVGFLFNHRTSLLQLVQVAGLCLVFRFAVGAVFGFMIAAMYSMNLRVSLTLGLSGYVPAIVLHVAAVPFILRPIIKQVVEGGKRRGRSLLRELEQREGQARSRAETAVPRGEEAAVPVEPRPVRGAATAPAEPLGRSFEDASTGDSALIESNGFDRATRYIGEDGSVHLAAVVDHEGLLLGQFSRGAVDAESWAPLALLLREANEPVLARTDWGRAERLSLCMVQYKVVAVFESNFNLLVIAERQQSDFLDIRINQALDTIRKYIAHRYNPDPVENAERQYESSTQ